jgi:hypothetical protein
MENIVELFCEIDDFCQYLDQMPLKMALPAPNKVGKKTRKRSGHMALSELMTIVVMFHQSHYRNFKNFYINHVHNQLRSAFPQLISYSRFIQLMPRLWLPLTLFLWLSCRGVTTHPIPLK